jgi:hypothetical protein
MTSTLQDAIGTVRAGNYEKAQQQLAEVIAANPDEVQAWYLLSQIVDSDARRAAYLSKTLSLDPYHQRAWAEFFSLPAEVVDRLEPGQAPAAGTLSDFSAPPPPVAATATAPVAVDVETALPDWLRPVAKDQPVVAQRRPAPVSAAPPPAAAPASPSVEPSAATEGNRTLSVLLAILLIATLVVLAFLVYLLLQG